MCKNDALLMTHEAGGQCDDQLCVLTWSDCDDQLFGQTLV